MAAESPPGISPPPPAPSSKIKITTTLPTRPLPPNAQRAPILTPRLVIRPFAPTDLDGIHALRSQPEVMQWTSVGRPDRDRAETQAFMDRYLPPNEGRSYDFVMCDRATGRVLGTGGMHKMECLELGWPEVGYMFRKEAWGRGLATEFLTAWTEAWWALPRSVVEVEVDADSVAGLEAGPGTQLPEMVSAMAESNNPGSIRVLEKAGFRSFKTWKEPDSRPGFENLDVELIGFALQRP
ncbi:Uu.00g026830.m01.CDS01 [Anthostomella pinea]|uniref:Uu.00g026830.m01.CDS01 n=1 Tax=Anthostomella pinea TaxID=933095 RepID=A0AAI8YCL3_9PEZI|nr:Uu.00g026830.m01.CDS01 [Anthostomella pinea]